MFASQSFAIALVEWFRPSQRDLLWRLPENINDPYRVLVSEMMLQQTTVAAVGPFYQRFLARFPTLESLATAPEAEVLAHWAGLGYYARARNLQKAAQTVLALHDGQFPYELEAILALPGVGRYTAGAVASIALNLRAPIVDANVARVLSRVLPVAGDLKTAPNQAKLWGAAQQLVEVQEVAPRELSSGLMELGALICTPKNPRCDVCPVAQFCEARKRGLQNELPYIAPKKALTPLFDVCALARNDNNEILLRQRPDEAGLWWRGMWELPRITKLEGESDTDALHRLGQQIGVEFTVGGSFARLKHGVTRYSIELECRETQARIVKPSPHVGWFDFESAKKLALPSTMTTLLDKAARETGSHLSLLDL